MSLKKYFITLTIILAVTACEDPYNNAVDSADTDYVTNDPDFPATALDNWLLNNFTQPFNIEVKYRWDASEADLYKTLAPPKVSQVQPLMEVVKDVWINPYTELAGESFIKTYCPKQFLLIGSARYNIDGTFTLGTAEGGRKVVLYVVNDFDAEDRSALKTMLHIVHHEFGHILNQKVAYPSSFREITGGGYTSDWRFSSVAQARANGFITNYAMASPDEDFVEMIATMLIEGREGYEAILACETTANARAILKRKEQLVVQYYKDAFNIDFYGLQTAVQDAINEIAPPDEGPEPLPPVFDQWGFDREKKTVRFDLTMLNEPAEFASRFSQDHTRMHNAGYRLDPNFKLYFSSENELSLKMYYYALDDEDRVYQQATFYFFVNHTDDGKVALPFAGADENGQFLVDNLQVGAVAAFFGNRTFTIDWVETCTGQTYVGFVPQDSPANYSFGMLEN
jgi:substrate import-associated zinc metallohydrolase lipoprotein